MRLLKINFPLIILSILIFPIISQAALSDGLVANWNFDVDFRATYGGDDFNGARVNGPMIDPNGGRYGGAAFFDRDFNQYVAVDAPVITQGEDFTYSAWYRATFSDIETANFSDRYFILESTGIGGEDAYAVSYGLRDIKDDGEDDRGQVYTQWPGGSADGDFDHPDLSQWHNIIVTYDAGASLHTAYLDGSQVLTIESSDPLSMTAGLIIGGHRDGTGRNWDGWIDDVGFWDRVVSSDEIEEIQASPLEYNETGMGRYLGRCLGLPDSQIHDAYLDFWALQDGANSRIPGAAFYAASGDSLEHSVLLTTGKARDGGLGNTDWADQPGFEFTVWGLHTVVPDWAETLRFKTQLISAEYAVGRPGVDFVEFSFWDNEGSFTDARLDTIAAMCSEAINPTLSHGFDVSNISGNYFFLQFTVGESSYYSNIDSALKISDFYYSDQPLPDEASKMTPAQIARGETPPEKAFINYIRTPMFSDVSLISGSYSYNMDLIDLALPMPLRFSLTYNTDSVRNGRLGSKWVHGYDLNLIRLNDGRVVIRHGNGQATYFEPDGSGGYLPMYEATYSSLVETSPGYFTYITESQLTYELSPLAVWDGYSQTDLVRDAQGNETQFFHTETGDRLLERLDRIESMGHTLNLSYTLVDTVELISGVSLNGHSVATMQYDAEGRLTSIIESDGSTGNGSATTSFTYDDHGRILTVTNGAGECEVTNWYEGNQLIAQADNAGNTSTIVYNMNQLTNTDRLGNQMIRRYDFKGRLATVEHPGGATASYEYDENGNLSQVTDALGNQSRLEYNSGGDLIRSIDALGNQTQYTYDMRHNMLTQTVPDGNQWIFTYDGFDNLIQETDPLGNVKTYAYSATGQRISSTDPLGNTTLKEYGATGFLESEDRPTGKYHQLHPRRFRQCHQHDRRPGPNGLHDQFIRWPPVNLHGFWRHPIPICVRQSRSHVAKETYNLPFAPIKQINEYDNLGRLESVSDGAGLSRTFAYDAEGQRVTSTDQAGRQTNYDYDLQGNLVQVTDPEGGVVSSTYNKCSQLTMTDPGGTTTQTTTDAMGRVVREQMARVTLPPTSTTSGGW